MPPFLIVYDLYFKSSVAINLISIVILCLIAGISYSYYRFCGKNGFLKLSTAFWVMALSFLFTLFKNMGVHLDWFASHSGIVEVTYLSLLDNVIPFTCVLISRFLFLLGLYILYQVFVTRHLQDHIIMILLLSLITYLSATHYMLFHFVTFVMLLIIALAYHRCYAETGRESTFVIMLSFILLSLSHAAFILFRPDYILYSISELIKFAGLLLILLTLVYLKYGKNK